MESILLNSEEKRQKTMLFTSKNLAIFKCYMDQASFDSNHSK